ncbi:MAG: TolC family protein [Planctomycetes bacterium]|nr:TolC family protein [Planctomycetota bacterium]
MKYLWRFLFFSATFAALFGCTSTLETQVLQSPKRQTTHFAGTYLPPHAIEISLEEENFIATLPDLSVNASLQNCLIYAALNAPKLEAAFHRWQAALMRIPQVSALSDPKLSFGYFLEEVQTRTGPMEQQLSLQQSFPWWGLLEAKGDVAAEAAAKLWHAYEFERLALFEKISYSWSSLVDLDAEINVVEESFALLEEAERIALRSYEVQETNHSKLIRLQVELGILEDNLHKLRDLRLPRQAALNAMLARPSNGLLTLPSKITLHSSTMKLEDAQRLLEDNPTIAAMDADIREQERSLDVATLDAKPKWTVGLTYTNLGDPLDPTVPDAGDNPLMGMIGFSIPLNQDKYDAAKREAISKRLAAEATRETILHELNANIAEAIYRRDDSLRRIELYETALLPRAEDALTAALSAFSAGKNSATELLDTQRTLLDLQRNLQRSYVSALNADATISKIIGGGPTKDTDK